MELKESLNQILTLPTVDLERLMVLAERIELPKHTTFIDQNKTSKYIYFLESGICRIFYPKEEKEVILAFCFPGQVILPLNSYIHDLPTYELVDTLTESVLHRIPIKKLQLLYTQSLPIANWGRKLAELETLKIEERLMQSLFKTATERYQDLLTHAPALLQQIKLGYIATYLGVSQVTLSRIRSEIR